MIAKYTYTPRITTGATAYVQLHEASLTTHAFARNYGLLEVYWDAIGDIAEQVANNHHSFSTALNVITCKVQEAANAAA